LKIALLRSLLKTAELLDFMEGKATESESRSEELIDVDLPLEVDLDENSEK
jgi:hypothetical protein